VRRSSHCCEQRDPRILFLTEQHGGSIALLLRLPFVVLISSCI
jgi:hypothetical protein